MFLLMFRSRVLDDSRLCREQRELDLNLNFAFPGSWVEVCPPKKTSGPQNVTLLGDGVATEVIELERGHQGGTSSCMTGVLLKRGHLTQGQADIEENHVKRQRGKTAVLEPMRQASGGANPANTLIPDIWPGTVRPPTSIVQAPANSSK